MFCLLIDFRFSLLFYKQRTRLWTSLVKLSSWGHSTPFLYGISRSNTILMYFYCHKLFDFLYFKINLYLFFLFHWVEYDQAMGGCTLIHWWHSITQLLLGNIMLAIKIFWMVSWITLHALSEANVVECVVHPTKPWMKGIILYS